MEEGIVYPGETMLKISKCAEGVGPGRSGWAKKTFLAWNRGYCFKEASHFF